MTKPKASNHLVRDSATVRINSLAQQKMAAGISVFNLSAGEPKLPPHPALVKAVLAALKQGKTLYPPVSGIIELKKRVSAWMNLQYGSNFNLDNCLVVNGGKFGIYLLAQLLLNPGDEVIMAAPYWVSYPAITQLFGGQPIIVNTTLAEHWKLTPKNLQKVCTPKSKILILNNATNPTGVLYSKQELAAILNVAEEKKLWVIADEVYSGLTYGKEAFISCAAFAEYHDRVLVIQSCSKNFSMTGWRIGFVLGPEIIIKALTSLVGQSTSGVTTISQWAAIAAFKNAKKINNALVKKMQKRRDVLIKALQRYFSITVPAPVSTLYVFIALKDLGVKEKSSVAFCEQALEQAHVAMVPGVAFGKEGYVRLSFGAEEEDLRLGIKKLAAFCQQIKLRRGR